MRAATLDSLILEALRISPDEDYQELLFAAVHKNDDSDDLCVREVLTTMPLTAHLAKLLRNRKRYGYEEAAARRSMHGWSLRGIERKSVWVPIIDLPCYVIFQAGERCTQGKIGLFTEMPNLVLAILAGDMYVCGGMNVNNVSSVHLQRQTEVRHVCTSDLINVAASFAPTKRKRHNRYYTPRPTEGFALDGKSCAQTSSSLKGLWKTAFVRPSHCGICDSNFLRNLISYDQREATIKSWQKGLEATSCVLVFNTPAHLGIFCQLISMVILYHTRRLISFHHVSS